MADIFISYSSHDRLQALSLAERLRISGYNIWIDQHHIQGANRWGKEIVQAIDQAKLVAVLISSSSLLSENVVKELNLAAERHKHLLPVMLEETELTEEFAYHLTGLHQVGIENTESILKAIEQFQILSAENRTAEVPNDRPQSQDIRLAILPFDDLSPKHDNEWFADGMLDELILTLGALEHMKVPSRTDVMYYKKHHPKAQEIASDLNVRYLVGGSVRKGGEKIRITASLTDAFTNQQLWTNHYDGTFDDIFDLQEKVAKQITEVLKIKLSREEKKKLEEQPTENSEAYELYLKGLEFHRRANRDAYEKALDLFEAAIAIDNYYVDAHLAIANTNIAYYRECSRDPKWLLNAEQHLMAAEKISGENAQTLWIKGEIAWQKENFEEAEKLLLRGAELDPNFEPTFNILGNLYLKTERPLKAAEAFKEAVKISETNIAYFNYLVALSQLNKPDELASEAMKALPAMEKYIQLNPEKIITKINFVITLFWADLKDEALKTANQFVEEGNLDGIALFNLGYLFEQLGHPQRNMELLKHAIQKGFREIEACRDQTYSDPLIQEEFDKIIADLKNIIEEEKKGNSFSIV